MASFLDDNVMLLAFSPTAVALLDTHAYRCVATRILAGPHSSPHLPFCSTWAVGVYGRSANALDERGSQEMGESEEMSIAASLARTTLAPSAPPRPAIITVALCSAFENCVAVMQLTLPPPPRSAPSILQPYPSPLSILSTAPLDPSSPLHSIMALAPRPKSDPSAALRARVTPAQRGKIVNRPLTFRAKIKSSGWVPL